MRSFQDGPTIFKNTQKLKRKAKGREWKEKEALVTKIWPKT